MLSRICDNVPTTGERGNLDARDQISEPPIARLCSLLDRGLLAEDVGIIAPDLVSLPREQTDSPQNLK